MTSKLTREELLNIIETDHVQCGEAAYLARIALAAIDSEPVAGEARFKEERPRWTPCTAEHVSMVLANPEDWPNYEVRYLYAAPQPAPVVPECFVRFHDIIKERHYGRMPEEVKNAFDECAAMLQAGNSPVIPDTWIPVSERMPEKNQNVLISVNFDSSLVEPLICSARYTGSTFRRGEATVKPGSGIEQATHWMPLPDGPQEVNHG